MIRNKIHKINWDEATELQEKVKNVDQIHFTSLAGKEIQSWEEYIENIESAYELPTKCGNNIDAYYDWMTDLSWLSKESYVLLILGGKDFLADKPEVKSTVMEGFANVILPWWEGMVEKYVVGGKAASFDIYLVD